MKTPAKKRTAAELAAAVLWCALTLGTDRLFFRYDWRTPAFFVYKALFLVLAFGLVHGAVTLVQKLRAQGYKGEFYVYNIMVGDSRRE